MPNRRGLPRLIEAAALVVFTVVLLVSFEAVAPAVDAVTTATPEYGLEVKSSHPTGATDPLEAARRAPVVDRSPVGGATREAPASLKRVTRLVPPVLAPEAVGTSLPARWAALLPEVTSAVTLYHFDGVVWSRVGGDGGVRGRSLDAREADDLARSLAGPDGMSFGEDCLVAVGDVDGTEVEAVISALVARSRGTVRRGTPWDGEGVASWLGLGPSRRVHALLR